MKQGSENRAFLIAIQKAEAREKNNQFLSKFKYLE